MAACTPSPFETHRLRDAKIDRTMSDSGNAVRRFGARPMWPLKREESAMRKLTSHLFISLDGVVEGPDRFLRRDLYQDLPLVVGEETLAEQDAVVLGRKQYEEWSTFWPDSQIEPFATFINNVPKYVSSKSLKTL